MNLISLLGADAAAVSRAAAENGAAVFAITSGTVAGRQGLVESIRDTLPLDPLVTTYHWDALHDSILAGVSEVEAPYMVIIWPDSSRLRDVDPDAFGTSILNFFRISEESENPNG